MIIAFSDADVKEYMDIILSHMDGNLVLIDKYMMGTELEVDAICDGEDVRCPALWSTSTVQASTPATPSQFTLPGI